MPEKLVPLRLHVIHSSTITVDVTEELARSLMKKFCERADPFDGRHCVLQLGDGVETNAAVHCELVVGMAILKNSDYWEQTQELQRRVVKAMEESIKDSKSGDEWKGADS